MFFLLAYSRMSSASALLSSGFLQLGVLQREVLGKSLVAALMDVALLSMECVVLLFLVVVLVTLSEAVHISLCHVLGGTRWYGMLRAVSSPFSVPKVSPNEKVDFADAPKMACISSMQHAMFPLAFSASCLRKSAVCAVVLSASAWNASVPCCVRAAMKPFEPGSIAIRVLSCSIVRLLCVE